MMVIAAGGEEQRAGITPDSLVEAQPAGVESVGVLQATDVQMYVAQSGTWRESIPMQIAPGCDHIVEVEWIGRHHQFTITLYPHLAGTIRVDLDSESVGIP